MYDRLALRDATGVPNPNQNVGAPRGASWHGRLVRSALGHSSGALEPRFAVGCWSTVGCRLGHEPKMPKIHMEQERNAIEVDVLRAR